LYRGGLLSITKYGPVHGGFNFLLRPILEQVDENSSPCVNVQNNFLEVNTPHHKQKTTRLGRDVQKPRHLRDFVV
jgi:hypothetical protein